MAAGGDETNPTFWQAIMTAVGMAFSFGVGAWTKGTAAGKTQGTADAQLSALLQRVTRLEQRHDSVDDKIGAMAERVAQMPTRAEMAQGFDRLESRLDGLKRG